MMRESIKDRILDISANLARVSDWISSSQKKSRVDQFLQETEKFVSNISNDEISEKFMPTFVRFKKELKKLLREKDTKNKYDWAERALTWANILQHRAKQA